MEEQKAVNEAPVITEPKVELPKQNRKQRRIAAARARRAPDNRKKYDLKHWVKRFAREMKDNKEVQERITSGQLDKYLD